jgi:hypothetical protein
VNNDKPYDVHIVCNSREEGTKLRHVVNKVNVSEKCCVNRCTVRDGYGCSNLNSNRNNLVKIFTVQLLLNLH